MTSWVPVGVACGLAIVAAAVAGGRKRWPLAVLMLPVVLLWLGLTFGFVVRTDDGGVSPVEAWPWAVGFVFVVVGAGVGIAMRRAPAGRLHTAICLGALAAMASAAIVFLQVVGGLPIEIMGGLALMFLAGAITVVASEVAKQSPSRPVALWVAVILVVPLLVAGPVYLAEGGARQGGDHETVRLRLDFNGTGPQEILVHVSTTGSASHVVRRLVDALVSNGTAVVEPQGEGTALIRSTGPFRLSSTVSVHIHPANLGSAHIVSWAERVAGSEEDAGTLSLAIEWRACGWTPLAEGTFNLQTEGRVELDRAFNLRRCAIN